MKSFYFISGLPRSGSTLLSSILKQNPNFHAGITSSLRGMCTYSIASVTKKESLLVSEEQRKNVIYGIFDGYYKHIKEPVVFDTNREWTKNTDLLRDLFPQTKIICTVRDIVSILNSFEVARSKSTLYGTYDDEEGTINRFDKNVFDRCSHLIENDNGVVKNPLLNLKESCSANPQMLMLVDYETMCQNPEKTFKKIYNFLGETYYSHDFKNVSDGDEKASLFDLQLRLKTLHSIKKEVKYNPPNRILPLEIINHYSNLGLEFWKHNNFLKINSIHTNLDL